MRQWFDLAADTNFFVAGDVFTVDEQNSFYAICMLVTLAFINLEQDFGPDASPDAYISSGETLRHVHRVLAHDLRAVAHASPAQLAWGLALNRVAIRLSDNEDPAMDSDILEILGRKNAKVDDRGDLYEDLGVHAGRLAERAVADGAVEKLVLILKSHLPMRIEYATVASGVLQALLPYYTLTEQLAQAIHDVISPYPVLVQSFFSDFFASQKLEVTRAKMPLSMPAFVHLARTLGSGAYEQFGNMRTYLCPLPRYFSDYVYLEDQQSTLIQLTGRLDVEGARGNLVLNEGTRGEIVAQQEGKTLVLWDVSYNNWPLLGSLLESSSTSNSGGADGRQIIPLVTSTLAGANAPELLSLLSSGLSTPDRDILDLITDRFDEALFDRDVDMCVHCARFLTAMVDVDSQRVWAYLGRSRMLERYGRGGLVATILAAVEIVNHRYDFSLAVIQLVQALVDDALATALDDSVSAKLQSDVLANLTRHLIDVYESFVHWRYADARQKLQIGSSLIAVFTSVIHAAFRVNDSAKLEDKVTGVVAAPAHLILHEFLSSNETSVRTVQPLLRAIESAASSTLPLGLGVRDSEDEFGLIEDILRFCSLLVRARSIISPNEPSALEHLLFGLGKELATIFLRYFRLHHLVVDVLEALIVGHWPGEQPSTLAYLGTEYSQMLISCLSTALRSDLELDATLSGIAHYFSGILKSKQEGLSILLVSGKDTRNTAKKVEKVGSLLAVFEQRAVEQRGHWTPKVLGSALEAISLAHSMTFSSIEKGVSDSALRADLCSTLFELIDDVSREESQHELTGVVRVSEELAMAARALDIISVEIYKAAAANNRDDVFYKPFRSATRLQDWANRVLHVRGYRDSLHTHLARNFNRKWPKTPLHKYARSLLLGRRPYGKAYAYDLGLLDVVLGASDSSASHWKHGYHNEVIEANVNLSYTHAQLELNLSFCKMINALASAAAASKDAEVLNSLRGAAQHALATIDYGHLSIPLFGPVLAAQLDMVFFVLYQLSRTRTKVCESSTQLENAFRLLADTSLGFTTGPVQQESYLPHLFRPLLRIINLDLDDFVSGAVPTNAHLIQLVQTILDTVVIRGMNACVVAVQQSKIDVSEDVVQITTVLRKCLKVPGISSVFANVVISMIDSGGIRGVLSLYSYGLSGATSSDEPIYGELALHYLLEWLKVDTMADHFVMNGLLTLLLESPISKLIQAGNIRANADPRLHSIWTKGILHIYLALIESLGQRMLREAIVFVNFFAAQIDCALRAWTEPSCVVSLSSIEETALILTLLDIIDKLRRQQIDHESLQVPAFTSYSDISDGLEQLLSHHKYLATKIAVTNAEERQIFTAKPADGEQPGEAYMNLIINELRELQALLETA